MFRFSFLLLTFFFLSSFSENETYNGKFIGKKLAETPFGESVKTGVPDKTVIMLVAYGCSHCWDATIAIDKLKKENLIDNIIILGNGTDDEKEEFKKNTATNYQAVDYDFETMKSKIFAIDPGFPPPPCAIFINKDTITNVFIEMPTVKQFKKMQK